jgi:hypothetical protein
MNAERRPVADLPPSHSALVDLATGLHLLAASGELTSADVMRRIEATGKALPELTIGELSRLLAETTTTEQPK